MISFTPTEDQQALLDTIRRYALEDVRAVAHEADEAAQPPLDVVAKGWQIGLVASAIPEDCGGLGELSAVTGVLATEAFAFGDLSVTLHMQSSALFAYPLILYGTAEQREQFLPQCADEKLPPLTAALLEPGLFFDANKLATKVTVTGDGYRLNGAKVYVPLAAESSHILVYALDEAGAVAGYIVERGAAGVTVGEREQLMGLRALPQYKVTFSDVALAASARVALDYGVMRARMNVALAAAAVGVANAALQYALEYSKGRVQFGKPIAQNQAVAFALAEMATDIDAARLMAWEAAWKLDQGQDAAAEAALSRQFADQMVLKACDNSLQLLGGYGFIREYPVERWLRNGRGFPVFTGLAVV